MRILCSWKTRLTCLLLPEQRASSSTDPPGINRSHRKTNQIHGSHSLLSHTTSSIQSGRRHLSRRRRRTQAAQSLSVMRARRRERFVGTERAFPFFLSSADSSYSEPQIDSIQHGAFPY